MSKFVLVADEIVWNPAQRTAVLFQDQLAAAERALGVPSGITEPVGDELHVDLPVFAEFLRHLLAGLTGGNPVWRLLLEGLAETCVAVHHAATGQRVDAPPGLGDLVDRGVKLTLPA